MKRPNPHNRRLATHCVNGCVRTSTVDSLMFKAKLAEKGKLAEDSPTLENHKDGPPKNYNADLRGGHPPGLSLKSGEKCEERPAITASHRDPRVGTHWRSDNLGESRINLQANVAVPANARA